MSKAGNTPEKERQSSGGIYPTETSRERELHEYKDAEGYDVNVEDGRVEAVKLAKHGHTKLIPQPSQDPNDPLNWPSRKKNLYLFIVELTAHCQTMVLPPESSFFSLKPRTYFDITRSFTTLQEASEWAMTEDEVNRSQVGHVFMLGAGGICRISTLAQSHGLPWLTANDRSSC